MENDMNNATILKKYGYLIDGELLNGTGGTKIPIIDVTPVKAGEEYLYTFSQWPGTYRTIEAVAEENGWQVTFPCHHSGEDNTGGIFLTNEELDQAVKNIQRPGCRGHRHPQP